MYDLVILIDDSEADNFFHKYIIEKSNCAKKVVAISSAIDALDYLNTTVDGSYPCPDLIFLDINMPKMDGWQFLEEYGKLEAECRGKDVIMMLSTSLNTSDKTKAEENKYVTQFLSKPLSVDVLREYLGAKK